MKSSNYEKSGPGLPIGGAAAAAFGMDQTGGEAVEDLPPMR